MQFIIFEKIVGNESLLDNPNSSLCRCRQFIPYSHPPIVVFTIAMSTFYSNLRASLLGYSQYHLSLHQSRIPTGNIYLSHPLT
jgi:hypothetical protein